MYVRIYQKNEVCQENAFVACMCIYVVNSVTLFAVVTANVLVDDRT